MVAIVMLSTTIVTAWDSYFFDLPSNAKESAWRDALAENLDGQIEIPIEGGRIDVLTDTMAIELDWPHKWHEGLGQALHYADATEKQGVVALISYSQGPENLYEKSRRRFQMVEDICTKSGIKLIILFPTRPREGKKQSKTDKKKVAPPETTSPKFEYWLNTRTGSRHNSNCRFYKTTTEGYECGPDEGKPCSICGG